MKMKKQMSRNHPNMKKYKRLLLNSLLPPYLVMRINTHQTLKIEGYIKKIKPNNVD